ncbi:hypothetical protein HDV01_001844 [Terramyces sp. JEL0728]|nr:hypothetical protein HDV01_001844 [Terramyces sp. JEL0728]
MNFPTPIEEFCNFNNQPSPAELEFPNVHMLYLPLSPQSPTYAIRGFQDSPYLQLANFKDVSEDVAIKTALPGDLDQPAYNREVHQFLTHSHQTKLDNLMTIQDPAKIDIPTAAKKKTGKSFKANKIIIEKADNVFTCPILGCQATIQYRNAKAMKRHLGLEHHITSEYRGQTVYLSKDYFQVPF